MDIARQEGKPEKILDKMVEGRMHNFYAERCLLEQPFVKDDKKTVGKVVPGGRNEGGALHPLGSWEGVEACAKALRRRRFLSTVASC